MILEFALMFCFPAAMCFAASMDLFTMTIPNRISLFLVIAFLVLSPLIGFEIYDIAAHICAGLLMLVLGMILFSQGWIGGGDAKIFAAAALWLGFEHLLTFAIIASFLGGILTIAILMLRKMPLPIFLAKENWALRLHNLNSGIPYGVALGAAALIVYPNTEWMTYINM